MTEFINATKNNPNDWRKTMNTVNTTSVNNSIPNNISKTQVKESKINISEKSDSFEKNDKKEKTKKIIKYGAIATGVALAVLAFFKRKQIGDFFSNLFKKKPKNPPIQPDAPMAPTDTPPIKNGGNPPTSPTAPAITKTQSSTEKLLNEYYELCAKYNEIDIEDPIRKVLNKQLVKMENQLRNIKGISWRLRPDMFDLAKIQLERFSCK